MASNRMMTNSVTDALRRLTTTFTVKEIMTPESGLKTGEDAESAAAVSASHPDFSIIPINKDGALCAYFERDSHVTRPINVDDLISDGTTLIELIEVLRGRDFSFVLANRRITGYVHYSDLNHQLVKWTFYVMLEAVERLALDSLRIKDEVAYLEARLSPERLKQLMHMYKRAGDKGRSLLTYLNIADILALAAQDAALSVDANSIRLMRRIRNWTTHPFDLPADTGVEQLASVKNECLRLLGANDGEKHTAAYV
jgi:hypothetical protein